MDIKDPTKSHMGRPRKEIDWKLFEDLCSLQCTQSEMASVLKVNQDTLRDKARKMYKEQDFSEIYKRYSESGKCSLRRYQFAQAKKNATMAIWLGKQWLGQKDAESLNKDTCPNDEALGLAYGVMEENRKLKARLEELEKTKAVA
jgi:hypothetical protein